MYRILVVEDDEVLRNGMVYALKKEGYAAQTAGKPCGFEKNDAD